MTQLNAHATLLLDLVEIAPKARPPVCKIIDYGKFLYEGKEEKSRSQEKAD